jgi:hypothetical protein
MIVMVYCVVGPRSDRSQLLLAGSVLTAVLLCAVVPGPSAKSNVPIEFSTVGAVGAAVGADVNNRAAGGNTARAVAAADHAVAMAAGAAAAYEAIDPAVDQAYDEANAHVESVDNADNQAPMPPPIQVVEEVPELDPAPKTSPEDEIRRAIDTNLRRGTCPQFISGPAPPQALYDALIRFGTQANLNQALADIVSTREPDPTMLYYRRERLETALAQDLISYQRNEGRGVQDRHLYEITPEQAVQGILEARTTADAARASERRGLHIGTI